MLCHTKEGTEKPKAPGDTHSKLMPYARCHTQRLALDRNSVVLTVSLRTECETHQWETEKKETHKQKPQAEISTATSNKEEAPNQKDISPLTNYAATRIAQSTQHPRPQILPHPCSLMFSSQWQPMSKTNDWVIKMRYTKKQYYSVTKNEIMKYITKCMNLEKIVLNEKT